MKRRIVMIIVTSIVLFIILVIINGQVLHDAELYESYWFGLKDKSNFGMRRLSNDMDENGLLFSQNYTYKDLRLEIFVDSDKFGISLKDNFDNEFYLERSNGSSLRSQYSLYITEVGGEYFLIEKIFCYGFAGVEEATDTIIHNISSQSVVEMQAKTIIGNSHEEDLPLAGTSENPFFCFRDGEVIEESVYLKSQEQFFNDKSVLLLALGAGGAGTIDVRDYIE